MVYKVYCDESGINPDSNFYFMGSVWIPAEKTKEFINEYYSRVKATYTSNPQHLKWTKVPSKSDSFFMKMYLILIDLFFEKEYIDFRMICVHKSEYDISSKFYHNGDGETGFYKLYYHLLCYNLQIKNKYHIRLASRNISLKQSNMSCGERLDILKESLNNKIFSKNKVKPVISVEHRNAQDKLLIQLADVLMGAVSFHYNNNHLENTAKEGKCFLSNYICQKLNAKSLYFSTEKSYKKFNIFNMIPKKR